MFLKYFIVYVLLLLEPMCIWYPSEFNFAVDTQDTPEKSNIGKHYETQGKWVKT